MLTMIHHNPLRIDGGVLSVDRKFLTGMQRYAQSLDTPIMAINPAMTSGGANMDMVDVACKNLGFQVLTVNPNNPLENEVRLREQIARSSLVYGSPYLGWTDMAKSLGVPYILTLEYDLKTQVITSGLTTNNRLKSYVRSLRAAKRYLTHDIPVMRRAALLHCNGYPIYEEARLFNSNRLLYLDSRISADMVVAAEQLEDRLQQLGSRPLRLLFTGRYEPMKGADQSLRVALECLRRGLNIEMHCYGQGSLRDTMVQLAQQSPHADRVHVHEPLTYPELSKLVPEFDVFVCCHVQNDPSCTYLETFGAGVPIVGYANRMWRHLCAASRGGRVTPIGRIDALVDEIAYLQSNPQVLKDLSRQAREFALAHTFENEFSLRINSIKEVMARKR
ncbi:MAG: hypothetical protein RL211_1844 [Pseudomonadota bacterium]|jgi:glycosyltransferase involved in cell wall biosynthesis